MQDNGKHKDHSFRGSMKAQSIHCVVRWLCRRPYSSVTSVLQDFRKVQLNAIEKMPIFGARELQDATFSFIQKRDFPVAGELLRAGLRVNDFDHKLGTYFIAEVLEDIFPEALDQAVTMVESMQKVGALNEFTFRLVLDKVFQVAAEQQMDILLKYIPKVIPWTARLIESLILRVYLPSLRSESVISLLRTAQKEKLVLQAGLWQTIFEVMLQPAIIDSLPLGRAAMRDTDRDFKQLTAFMREMETAGVKLEKKAVDALTEIAGTTIVPKDFLLYLESYAP